MYRTEEIRKLRNKLRSVYVYQNVLKDAAMRKVLDIMDLLCNIDKNLTQIKENYGAVFKIISDFIYRYKLNDNVWENYVKYLLLQDENIFSLTCEKYGFSSVGENLRDTVESEIITFEKLANFNIQDAIFDTTSLRLPDWNDFIRSDEKGTYIDMVCSVKVEINDIYKFYESNGCGIYSKYKAFKWLDGTLEGISGFDDITLDHLIEYQSERDIILKNTESFLKGLPSSNILIYGERGTGKSSTVKAIINQYWRRGLRLIEMDRDDMSALHVIIKTVAQRGLKYILFFDDLSFEEMETNYRKLKSLLEGGAEKLPDNVIIYATSNRRHIVKELISDNDMMGSSGEEMHARDTKEEKMSLADRFGITVTYSSPDQLKYLKIVEGLAEINELKFDKNILKEEALRWAMWHNGRSPRTAKQFIDHLLSKRSEH